MFGSCPRCGGQIHNHVQSVGLSVCKSCGWFESRNQLTSQVQNENRTMVALAVAAVTTLLVIAHSINWGQYSLEIPFLKTGQVFGILSQKSYDRLASICVDLGKYSCARTAYIDSFQNNHTPEPLAKLARLQVSMQETQVAMVTMAAYFRNGGKDADAAFLYGQLLEQSGNETEALKMYQASIQARPETLPIAATGAIIRILMKQGQYEDAHQRILEFQASAGNAKGYLNTELNQVEQALVLYKNGTKSKTKRS